MFDTRLTRRRLIVGGTTAILGTAGLAVATDGAEEHIVDVPVEIAFVVRDDSGGMLVQARAADTAAVTVTPGGVAAAVGGSATLVAQDDQSDPTPAPPEGG